jgi:hypothetical protein
LSAEAQNHLKTYWTTFDEAGETLNFILKNEILLMTSEPLSQTDSYAKVTHMIS